MIRVRSFLITFIIGILVARLAAQQPAPGPSSTAQQIFVPPGTESAYDTVHYAPAIRVGDLVVVSGVAAVGPGEFEDQVRRMFDRIKTALAAAGATMEDVVELQTFHRGGPDSAAFQAEFRRFRAIHDEYFTGHYPAWTAIGNATLLAPNALVETRVMAIAGSGKNAVVHREPSGPSASALAPVPPAAQAGTAPARPDPATLAPKRIDLAAPVTVPARLIYGNRPTVDVMINGRGPFHLSIETGGPYALALSQAVTTALALGPADGPFGLWNIDALQIGGLTLHDLKARATPGGGQPFPGADGLLGLAAFRDLVLTIDYPHARVTVASAASGLTSGPDVLALEPAGMLLAARADVGGHSTPLIVDTQSGGITVMCNPMIAAGLSFVETPVVVGQAVVSGMVSAPVDVSQARLAGDVRVGPFSIQHPIVDIAPMPPALGGMGPICTMGSDLLSNFSVTLDQKNRRLRLARDSAVVPPPGSTYTLGLSLDRVGAQGDAKVLRLSPDGPAARAGLHVGDLVGAVDGQPLTDESGSAVALGKTAAGARPVRITVDKGGHPADIVLTPQVVVR